MKLVALLLLIASQVIPQEKDVNNISWLAGTWVQEKGESILLETWNSISPLSMEGVGYSIAKANNDTTFSEDLRIVKMGNEIYYIVKVSHNGNPVSFKLISYENKKLIFENKNHDFPQRIIYNLISPDSLNAAIEGIVKNQFKRIDFYFSKLKSENNLPIVDLELLKYFTGSWEGHETGRAGIGKGEREYQFIMNGKYLHFKNKSVFEPQEKNPKGKKHEDWGFFSYDKNRKAIVLRQFHIEGFVNQYILDSVSADGRTITLTTEKIENIAEGWKARYILEILNENEFTETFELAAPGKNYSQYLKNHWKRKAE